MPILSVCLLIKFNIRKKKRNQEFPVFSSLIARIPLFLDFFDDNSCRILRTGH